MSKPLPSHIKGLLAYLSRPEEKANEDLAIGYFRKIFGSAFTRQHDAKRSDGYVAGHFVLELKGKTNDWLSGLFQGLAYKNSDLAFSQIVVACKSFLAVWQVDQLPDSLRDEILVAKGSPSSIGKLFAKQHSKKKNELLGLAIWKSGVELTGSLFNAQPELLALKIESFEKTLKEGRKVRQKITAKNFTSVLTEMKMFFDPAQPIKAVRAFYSMLYGWNETSVLKLSEKVNDQAALGGESVTNLVPALRHKFKDFVEGRVISLGPAEHYDDFFARYDSALDAVDKDFRIKHGIFFTDLDLSKFVMWLVRRDIPNLGKNYLVIDPACGSGNLVSNWRSPLELRHKVVSEIEPELLFAVERRMKGDQWHDGKFTVVPKTSENKGLNFLDCSAADYLNELKRYLAEKGHEPDKPLAFLCNPPYRSDDDQAAQTIAYKIHPSIIDVTKADASSERYCCFLAQMKLICEAAKDSGLPGDSLLLLFTKSAWLTNRSIFQSIRTHMLGVCENVAGILINGREFFDVKGCWPVAFTVWRYKGKQAHLDPYRSIPLIDLTWLKRQQLTAIPWDDMKKMQLECQQIIDNSNARQVELGTSRTPIKEWSGETRHDFMRGRRKVEKTQKLVGGLPLGDHRQNNKKAYGESNGKFIGFMDDLTPCRIKKAEVGKPWFRLNNQFMDVKKNRCFSAPPTHWGYCAYDLESAKKLFLWYSLARTLLQHPYPMWVDADDMWAPRIPSHLTTKVYQTAFAIAYAENECIEARFPANNPVAGTPELLVKNPMTPLNPKSFWSTILLPYVDDRASSELKSLIAVVNNLFNDWKKLFRGRTELQIAGKKYLLDDLGLTLGAGIIQIKDFATETNNDVLCLGLSRVQDVLNSVKSNFFNLISSKDGLDYFGPPKKAISPALALPEKTKFERILAKRLAVAAVLVDSLSKDPHFGRTKLAKLFYLSDVHEGLALETQYYRHAAGPLDPRALYNESIGIESLAGKYSLFTWEPQGSMVRYKPANQLPQLVSQAGRYLGNGVAGIKRLAGLFRTLDTEQSEIIATLYAVWNDFLLRKRKPIDDDIIDEFLNHWHTKKGRFAKKRLVKALAWMRQNNLVPLGNGKPTSAKATHTDREIQ